MGFRWSGFLFLLLVLCGGTSLTAGEIVIDGDEEVRTLHCDGDTVRVSGNENRITLLGRVAKLVVSGHENEVRVEAVGAITVSGFDHRVVWERGIGKDTPVVSNLGQGCTVEQGPVREKGGGTADG
ncbi:MAG: DUF3060 domain-containing protein [Acidobacteria bacterium]|nr:DUF3060 domain-containing protein [Acidobacteriota bacterium]